jgi:DNA polymerase
VILIIFYDFECFAFDWLVVLIDPSKKQETVIVNDPDHLNRFYEENKHDIWVGYNNNHYDQYILKAILLGMNPKNVNDWIIEKDKQGWQYSSLFRTIPMNNYDVANRTDRGLKFFQGCMGSMIKESSISFDTPRKLTEAEIQETVKYCRHDVEETIKVFLQKIDDFNTIMYFIKHFNLPLSDVSLTKAQLAAKLLGANDRGKLFDDEFQFPILDCLDLKKYRYVADWYKNPKNHDYSKSQNGVIVAGVEHKFSWGGGHGAIPKFHAKGDFLIIDVTAYYPTLQELFKFGYRVMDNPENFEFIHGSNIKFKREGNKKARQPFKILDNAISGQMKQKSSKLYDPMGNNSICVNGQLLLLDLIEHLEPYCKLIQNNTDGIIVQLMDYDRDFDKIDSIVSEWEKRTGGLKMDFETFFGEIFQKDVNNYLLIDHENGSIKRKGSYVKKLSDLDCGDFPIVNKALVEYMAKGIPVEQTIKQCDQLKEFQMVTKIGRKYKHLRHGAKNLNERCVRAFASLRSGDGDLTKFHIGKGKYEKVASSPDRCFLFNDEIHDVKCPAYLDKQFYVDMAKKRLNDFGVLL